MSQRAWTYIAGVLFTGILLIGLTLRSLDLAPELWPALLVLALLTTFAQLVKVLGPSHEAWHINLVFLFAGVLLLPPSLFVLLVTIPHLIEWAKERLTGSASLRNWYIQPFNITVHIISGLVARQVYMALDPETSLFLSTTAVLAAIVAAVIYLSLNHFLIGQALVLARGVSWSESGILGEENLISEFALLSLGYITALSWRLNPWLILPALSSLVLIYRALMIPQLKQEARIDDKTGLYNARFFKQQMAIEMERARRFDRALAIIVADLDLLRNINNTYGHLAGDAVLAGVGQAIRSILREYDVAGRFGGEEFTILLPEASLIEAQTIAERLRQAVESTEFHVQTSNQPIHATVTLGVACFPEDAEAPDDLLHEADVAMYQGKLRGKNQVVCASDVPHFLKLQGAPLPEQADSPYGAASTAVPRPDLSRDGKSVPDNGAQWERNNGTTPDGETASAGQAAKEGKERPAREPIGRPRERPLGAALGLFIAGVIVASIAATILGIIASPAPDSSALITVGVFAALALVAMMFEVRLFGRSTMSVLVSIIFAAALVGGIFGIVAVSTVNALVHYLRHRPKLYKTALNWSTHVLAGLAPFLVVRLLPFPVSVSNLPLLAIPIVLAGLVFYLINTGLVAIAMSLSEGSAIVDTWREQFRWLAGQYLVLCIIGLFLGAAYTALGLLGVIVFALPAFMMHYTQKQYVERTEDSVRELRRMNQELTLANREIGSANQAIRQLNDELFFTLSRIIDLRDPFVHGHATKVSDYATAIAEELKLPEARVEQLRRAGLLHDIGKIGVSEQVLYKPAKLSPEEYEHVKTHVTIGADLLETSRGLRHLAPFIRHHHEWWDGSGYPNGLRGEQIPLEARILAVCDAVEAMASDRPYQQAMPLANIIAELQRCSGVQFDSQVVQAFVRVARKQGQDFVINSARNVTRRSDSKSPAAIRPEKTA